MIKTRQIGLSLDLNDVRPEVLDSVRVVESNGARFVICFCGAKVKRSVVPHMKTNHPEEWENWIRIFIDLRHHGLTLKKIMRLFRAGNDKLLFSWTVIDRAIRSSVEQGNMRYSPPPITSIKSWHPVNFKLESNTIWNFPTRGSWAVHVGDYRGNWPPQLARNLLLRYTAPGDLVLDPFMGGGTTLYEAWLLNRYSVGIDISNLAYQTVTNRLEQMHALSRHEGGENVMSLYKPRIIRGDSTFFEDTKAYDNIAENSVNLLCVHPPYLDALTYTNGTRADLSQLKDAPSFLERIAVFARKSTAYLAQRNICAVLIGDVRKNGRIFPLGAQTLQVFLDVGFVLEEIIVKTQNRDRSDEFYFTTTERLLLAHEYLYILRFPKLEVSDT